MIVHIDAWRAVAPSVSSLTDWQDLVNNVSFPKGELNIDTGAIPPMLRRRCSTASKIALSLALPLLESSGVDAGVFCSQHGELANTVSIFEQMLEQEVFSPNKFSQCVHNTASGLLSVYKKLTIPFNSIAAGKETFQMGLVDALIQDYQKVLFVVFDDYVPSSFDSESIEYDLGYGAAMLLSKKPTTNSIALDITIKDTLKKAKELPPALEFVSWFAGQRDKALVLPALEIREVD